MVIKSRRPKKVDGPKKITSTTVNSPGKSPKSKKSNVKAETSAKKTNQKKTGKSVSKVSKANAVSVKTNVKEGKAKNVNKNKTPKKLPKKEEPMTEKSINKELKTESITEKSDKQELETESFSEEKLVAMDEQLRKSVKKVREKEKEIKQFVRNRKEEVRGCVYFSHLPHGFYEEELRGYLSQFGSVTGVYVPRNRKSGRAKGYAFVEFRYPEVANVVADTMNNYLMFDKLVKAEVVPPEKQRSRVFHRTPQGNRRNLVKEALARRKKLVRSEFALKKSAQKNLKRKQDKLKALGFDFKIQTDRKLIAAEALKTEYKKPKDMSNSSSEAVIVKSEIKVTTLKSKKPKAVTQPSKGGTIKKTKVKSAPKVKKTLQEPKEAQKPNKKNISKQKTKM